MNSETIKTKSEKAHKRRTALVTCIDRYMGIVIKEKFESLNIEVIEGRYPMTNEAEVKELVSNAAA